MDHHGPDLEDIRDRAASAAQYGKEGFFVDTLITVAGEDVPALLAEIERLRAENADLKRRQAA